MKTSIPNSHASAAIYEILDKTYNGPLNIILKVFIEKKLALPAIVLEKIVDWFLSFKNREMTKMPVLWYQTLLSFSKLYKSKLIRTP